MKKRMGVLALLGAVVLTLSLCTLLQAQQQRLADKLLRLHVVASSDSKRDQAIKLCVRDAVLAKAEQLSRGSQDPVQAVAQGLGEIEAAANAVLRRQGCAETAAVSLRRELFPTRAYETFSLPAGVYPSLRVTIGQGAGHNWWCVIFPALCVAATGDDLEQAAAAGGFSAAEIDLMTQQGGYTVKFRALELLQAFKNALFGLQA